ncbi:hypothetical protein [Streptomyces demainii]|uniref:Uncharacterized protein n=1 Tax=Streptomyces demainii TaxID=588122 RepID=A0ABT9KXE3_9ACTN|nr:hypothetical protein [Streptomyces demainii]MDP9613103.1 hypothetical protein [Streptomyces demainii]
MSAQPRLLPWNGMNGQPAYLVTEEEGTGHVSKLADEMEAFQLHMATELVGHALELLGNSKAEVEELRFLSNRMIEALRDALRIAESRGRRLGLSEEDGDDGPDQANEADG